MERCNSMGAKLREEIGRVVERARETLVCSCSKSNSDECALCLRRRVVDLLCLKGFSASLRTSKWRHTHKFPGGNYVDFSYFILIWITGIFCLPLLCGSWSPSYISRITWIYRGNGKHPWEEEANPIPYRARIPNWIRDGQSLRWVPQTHRPTPQILHRKIRLPQRHPACGMRCRQEVHEGAEDPHGAMAEAQLHADEMVRLQRQKTALQGSTLEQVFAVRHHCCCGG